MLVPVHVLAGATAILLPLPPFRILPFVALAAMAFWLRRLRSRRASTSAVGIGATEAI